MRVIHQFLIVLCLPVLSGCVTPAMPDLSEMASFIAPNLPAMQWDRREEAREWTLSTLEILSEYDTELAAAVPSDIDTWCPRYKSANRQDRRAFWSGLLSAIAKYESSWNPKASGGGGRYIGLMQISPKTAARNDCGATSSAALKDGAANLSCAVRIIAAQVGRDGLVAGKGNRGAARDWGPMKSAGKRAEMSAWTSSQAYCR